MAAVYTRIRFGPEWKRAPVALTYVDKRLPRDIANTMLETTQRGVASASAKALTIPAKKGNSKGTRKLVSRGVHYRKSSQGYRILTSMPAGMEMLPRGYASQWHHPVFGGEPHVLQQSHYDWFVGPIADEYDFAYRNLVSDLNNAADTIDKMTG